MARLIRRSFGDEYHATNTINNDNSYGTLQFSAPSYVVNENGGYATFTVIRTGGDAGAVSVNFTNIPGPSPNGATNGVNYIATNGVLNFAAGQIAASFNVTILPDGRESHQWLLLQCAIVHEQRNRGFAHPGFAHQCPGIYCGYGFPRCDFPERRAPERIQFRG